MTPVVSPLDIPGVWKGERLAAASRTQRTGYRDLDGLLQGGWPIGQLTQIVSEHDGLGFSLMLPMLAEATTRKRYIALLGTPFIPYAPALHSRGVDLEYLVWVQPERPGDALWAMEQIVRSGLFAVVCYWGTSLDTTSERRLQLAADAGDCVAVQFCTGARDAHSYAAVRLAVDTAADADLEVEVLKCRGTRPGRRWRSTNRGRLSA